MFYFNLILYIYTILYIFPYYVSSSIFLFPDTLNRQTLRWSGKLGEIILYWTKLAHLGNLWFLLLKKAHREERSAHEIDNSEDEMRDAANGVVVSLYFFNKEVFLWNLGKGRVLLK